MFMAHELEISAFIHGNHEWEKRLSEPPYCIITKRKDGYVLLKYTQRGVGNTSDFSLGLVRECRGIILDETNDYVPVCVPFLNSQIMVKLMPTISNGIPLRLLRKLMAL